MFYATPGPCVLNLTISSREGKQSGWAMRRQRHGLVIRGDEAARAIRVDRLIHDAVVLQRRTDLWNKVDGHAELVKQLATGLGVDTPVTPVHRDGETEVDKTAEDARTSWIDVDAQQERHKAWRSVVQERYVERHHDCELEGPDTVMHLLKHMMRFRGSPRGWIEMWCREHHTDRKDRTCHELETLTEVLLLGGTCDQLKMPSLMSFEKVCRRVQLIVEAFAEVGQAPSWKMARYYKWCH